MTDQILWFATRGAGVVSLLLSTAVVCLGLLTVVRLQRPSWPRFLTAQLHRSIALLSLVFLGIHIATAILDPFTSLGLVAAVVPLASSYRPVAVAFGVIAVDLVLALVITSLFRHRIGHRIWRTIHWLAYGAWPLAVLHGITAGSDAVAPWMLAVDGLCVLAVLAALAWRISAGASPRRSLASVAADRSGLVGARSPREI
jgi:methionine sulfoxide reductase heme-binding subunit